MFQRPQDIVPQPLINELLRLARLDRNWLDYRMVTVGDNPYQNFGAHCKYPSFINELIETGSDTCGLYAASMWLVDGPKVFRPTVEQCEALEQIEVNLALAEYSQPYQSILVDLPKGRYDPFHCVMLCRYNNEMVVTALYTPDHQDDILSIIGNRCEEMEESISRFKEDCKELAALARIALRVAINSCLALANFGCVAAALYPKELASDQRLAREDTPRGARARERVAVAPQLVSFNQTVKLHHTEVHDHHSGEHSGVEVRPHWRKGHWAMQPYGPKNTLRKRILRPPVFVRADRFLGDKSETSTTYLG